MSRNLNIINYIIMAFDKKYSQFGVLKIDGTIVKVYSDSGSFTSIHVWEKIVNASWAGDFVIVTVEGGKVRRYSDIGSFTTI